MKKPKRYIIAYILTLPADIIMWLCILVMWLLWGTKLRWHNGLEFELKKDSWPARTWYRVKTAEGHKVNEPHLWEDYGKWATWSGTSFGHARMYGPGMSDSVGTVYHEHIHTEQVEATMTMVFVMQGSVVIANLLSGTEPMYILHLILWSAGGGLLYASSSLAAWLRGEDPYKGNMLEESAYDQTELEYPNG